MSIRKVTVSTPIVASRPFGPDSRYRIDLMRTRFDTLMFFVLDTTETDAAGLPVILGQYDEVTHLVLGIRSRLAGIDPETGEDVREWCLLALARNRF